jgi:hypothetical protein
MKLKNDFSPNPILCLQRPDPDTFMSIADA